jgi:hypothetical protein
LFAFGAAWLDVDGDRAASTMILSFSSHAAIRLN